MRRYYCTFPVSPRFSGRHNVRQRCRKLHDLTFSFQGVGKRARGPPPPSLSRVSPLRTAGVQHIHVRYYVTGDLTPSLYRPDCLFTDPTTRVESVERYTAAVKLLFDPNNAQVDLLSLAVKDDTHIFAEWRLQGYLKFPWHPYVKPYTG
ncbi:unnamed protein product, partial [Ectocarpus sp. 8 AP-2014]